MEEMVSINELACVVCEGRGLVLCYGRICVDEEEIHSAITQGQGKASLAVPPPVLLPKPHIQLHHSNRLKRKHFKHATLALHGKCVLQRRTQTMEGYTTARWVLA